MSRMGLKVGELAERTGLTVRTLHHYDDIGLLKPSERTGSGHRLYTDADVARLQQVVSLRQFGFSLEEIRECLTRGDFSPLDVLRKHAARLQEQIELQRQLRDRLENLAVHLERAGTVSADEFLHTIAMMNMIESYYTPEQMEYLKQRRAEVGEERIQQAPNDWAQLYTDFEAAMQQGLDPADPRVQALEQRRLGLIREFTGGDAGIECSLTRLWQEQGDTLRSQYGYPQNPKLDEYMKRVSEAAT